MRSSNVVIQVAPRVSDKKEEPALNPIPSTQQIEQTLNENKNSVKDLNSAQSKPTSQLDQPPAKTDAEDSKAKLEASLNPMVLVETSMNIMAHEIRNNLNELRAGLYNIRDEAQGRTIDVKKIQSTLKTLQSIIDDGKTLVNDQLDWARTKAGKMPIRKQPIQLLDFLKSVLKMLQFEARAKKINFKTYFPSRNISIISDEQCLTRILKNLISNAIKFTPNEGNITLQIIPNPSKYISHDIYSCQILVKDTGIGMDQEQQRSLFQNFRRVHLESPGSPEGTGLGLAYAKMATEHLGGTLNVESKPNEGTTFILNFNFPKMKKMREESPSRISKSSLSIIRPWRPLYVLAVDDVESNVKLTARIVSRLGHTVETATSGNTAIEKYQNSIESGKPFDVIFMDIGMPEKDGWVTTKEIRELELQKNQSPCFIVVMSGNDLTDEEIFNNPIDSFITKPITEEGLNEQLELYFAEQERLYEEKRNRALDIGALPRSLFTPSPAEPLASPIAKPEEAKLVEAKLDNQSPPQNRPSCCTIM